MVETGNKRNERYIEVNRKKIRNSIGRKEKKLEDKIQERRSQKKRREKKEKR